MSLTLTTDRLTLRRPDGRDTDRVISFYQTERSHFVGGPLKPSEAWRQHACEIGHWDIRGYGMWAVTETATGATVGMVGPWHPEGWPEKEIGWLMFEAADGKGYATEAARAAVQDAFVRLEWDTAVSYVDPLNVASARVAQKLGAVIDPDAKSPYPNYPDDVYRHPKVAA